MIPRTCDWASRSHHAPRDCASSVTRTNSLTAKHCFRQCANESASSTTPRASGAKPEGRVGSTSGAPRTASNGYADCDTSRRNVMSGSGNSADAKYCLLSCAKVDPMSRRARLECSVDSADEQSFRQRTASRGSCLRTFLRSRAWVRFELVTRSASTHSSPKAAQPVDCQTNVSHFGRDFDRSVVDHGPAAAAGC